MTDELLGLAVRAAHAAGDLLRERFSEPRTGVGTKSSATDMVTDSDRASEDLIVALILGARPNDGVLGEESGERAGSSGVHWIIDPLDGTTNFLYGIPHFAVSIAAEDQSGMRAGVVYDVIHRETFAASRDAGATCNGARISVSAQHDLAHALLATGFSYESSERQIQAGLLDDILPRVRDIRRSGSAALDLAWTAAGRFDLFFEARLAPWDVAAGELVVREAGGTSAFIDAGLTGDPGVLAGSPECFDALRALVDEAVSRARAATR